MTTRGVDQVRPSLLLCTIEIRPDGVILERAGQRRRISLAGGTTAIAETDLRRTGTAAGR